MQISEKIASVSTGGWNYLWKTWGKEIQKNYKYKDY